MQLTGTQESEVGVGAESAVANEDVPPDLLLRFGVALQPAANTLAQPVLVAGQGGAKGLVVARRHGPAERSRVGVLWLAGGHDVVVQRCAALGPGSSPLLGLGPMPLQVTE